MFFQKKQVKYSHADICALVKETNLKHVAFIMDGNGRWAQKRKLPREVGHKAGSNTFEKIIKYCSNIGIQYVTVYAFSSENWKRPENEIEAIMSLLDVYIKKAKDDKDENRVRCIFIGDKSRFPGELAKKMEELESLTKEYTKVLNIAVNYGGQNEIIHAVNEALKEGKKTITKEDIENNLYTKESPMPDMIVRTGDEKRISNFLMWQSAYSELYFTPKLWPDMNESDVDDIVIEFSKRKRRFGGL